MPGRVFGETEVSMKPSLQKHSYDNILSMHDAFGSQSFNSGLMHSFTKINIDYLKIAI